MDETDKHVIVSGRKYVETCCASAASWQAEIVDETDKFVDNLQTKSARTLHAVPAELRHFMSRAYKDPNSRPSVEVGEEIKLISVGRVQIFYGLGGALRKISIRRAGGLQWVGWGVLHEFASPPQSSEHTGQLERLLWPLGIQGRPASLLIWLADIPANK